MSSGTSQTGTPESAPIAGGAPPVTIATDGTPPVQTRSPQTVALSSGQSGFSSSPFGNTLSQPFSFKLDRNNYVLWKTMISTVIRGHRLDNFINGSKQAPSEFIPEGVATGDGLHGFSVRPNPAFEE